MKRKVTEIVTELAKPFCDELGLTLWDVLFLKEGSDRVLRIIIDKDGGVGIEDCVNLSHALDEPLDELDPIDESYSLEVQSPGLERELRTDYHLEKYLNEKVKIKSQVAVNGKKEHCGLLKSYTKDMVIICANGENVEFERKLVSHIKADDFDI